MAPTWLTRAAVTLAVIGGIVVIAAMLQAEQSRATGPRPIVWGEEACTHCRMHVSEPRFAAQIVTGDGLALNFDDPGCLLLYLADTPLSDATAYFHHANEDRWLTAPAVAFARSGPTPMGYDLVAVDPPASAARGIVDLATARRIVLGKARNGAADGAHAAPGNHAHGNAP